MLEARGLVHECISKGDQSSGFKEFWGLAPGLLNLPGDRSYRIYIESLFDEIGRRSGFSSIVGTRRACSGRGGKRSRSCFGFSTIPS